MSDRNARRRPAAFSRGRRDFMKRSAAASLALGLPGLASLRSGLFALDGAPRDARTLVVVYLRGGADALNVVVPWSDPLYRRMRPTLAIGAGDEEDAGPGVIKLDDRFGLHPSLSGLEALWRDKALMPIVAAGSPHPTRSHFDAQDFMEYAAPGARTVRDGWLNRWLAAHPLEQGRDGALRAVAMQRLLPRAMRGRYPAVAAPDRRGSELEDVLDVFDDLYGESEAPMEEMGEMGERPEEAGAAGSVVDVGRETIETLRRLNEILDRKDAAKDGVAWPRTDFARRLERISRVIRADAGLEITALDLGGWDTHANQGALAGPMPNLLKTLGDGLGAFMTSLGDRRDNVCVVVMSEFGRTCLENGSGGTDHGHGSVMFVMGGGVQGGAVRGSWPGLAEKKLYEGRDLQVTTDFREVFRELIEGFLRTPLPSGFFPSYVLEKKRLRFWD